MKDLTKEFMEKFKKENFLASPRKETDVDSPEDYTIKERKFPRISMVQKPANSKQTSTISPLYGSIKKEPRKKSLKDLTYFQL